VSREISCPWCNEMTPKNYSGATWCQGCGHRCDVPRSLCTCLVCVDEFIRRCNRRARQARRREEEYDE
jgi:hypothetical protein